MYTSTQLGEALYSDFQLKSYKLNESIGPQVRTTGTKWHAGAHSGCDPISYVRIICIYVNIYIHIIRTYIMYICKYIYTYHTYVYYVYM